MTKETILPELIGKLAELPEHIQKTIRAYGRAYGAVCYRQALESERVQALKRDKDRLDWLEAQTKKSYTGISFDYNRHVEDGYVIEHGYRFMSGHFASGYMNSLRKTIDSAMEREND